MPRFDVYTNATVKQGLRYTVTARTSEEALRKVRDGSLGACHVKVMGEDCVIETIDWVWDEEGNDVTPGGLMKSDYRE